jgi:hypothetical protein
MLASTQRRKRHPASVMYTTLHSISHLSISCSLRNAQSKFLLRDLTTQRFLSYEADDVLSYVRRLARVCALQNLLVKNMIKGYNDNVVSRDNDLGS